MQGLPQGCMLISPKDRAGGQATSAKAQRQGHAGGRGAEQGWFAKDWVLTRAGHMQSLGNPGGSQNLRATKVPRYLGTRMDSSFSAQTRLPLHKLLTS